MITLDVAQGSEAWLEARLGIPTASEFHRILTPRTRKPAAAAAGYMYELLAEWAIGIGGDSVQSAYIERGSIMEQEAVRWYEMEQNTNTETAGFLLSDDQRYGCSPDRLVGMDGGLEVKCPGVATHIGYMLNGFGEDHILQVQGALLITGRAWWDTLSYNPVLPPVFCRRERDEELIGLLADALADFCERLDEAKARLLDLGVTPDDHGTATRTEVLERQAAHAK